MGAWHGGRSGTIGGHPLYNITAGSIGVELENAGRLEKLNGEFYCAPYWHKQGNHLVPDPRWRIPAERAVLRGTTWLDSFPPAQIEAAEKLVRALVARFSWKREACAYEHRKIDPSRREDPGELWSQVVLPVLLDRVFKMER